jgi:hypothetical protein
MQIGFRIFSNIPGYSTFLCKNISTDQHSGQPVSPELPLSRLVTELSNDVQALQRACTNILLFSKSLITFTPGSSISKEKIFSVL